MLAAFSVYFFSGVYAKTSLVDPAAIQVLRQMTDYVGSLENG